MAIKRVVSTEFWTDEKVINDFTPEDKYFFLYLLTNPHSSLLGVYKLVPKQAAFEMGYSVDAVNALLERFDKKYRRIKYNNDTCEVAIRNYLKHGIVTGGKPIRDRLEKDAQAVKDKSLLAFIADANEDNANDTVQQFLATLPPAPPTYGDGNGNGNGNGESSTTRQRLVNDSSQTQKSCSYETIKNETLQNKETGEKCEWCGCMTSVIHEHHHPIPKRLGGTSVVRICSNCHAEFHKREGQVNGDRHSGVIESRRFTPPSLTEVQAYCTERNNKIDAQRFIDFYESKGWLIGKNKMKDWRAAIRNWESRDNQDKPKEPDYTKGWGEYA